MPLQKFFNAEENRNAWRERISWYQRLFREALDGSVEGCEEALEEEPFVKINFREAYGETALHYAARGGQAETAEFLLLKGADPNAQDVFGDTPLIDALKYAAPDVVSTLLRHPRIHVGLANHDGQAPLHIAAERGSTEIVQSLLEKGANINRQDAMGNTPLVVALSQGNLNVALALVDAGADASIWGMSGMSPAEILRLLKERFSAMPEDAQDTGVQSALQHLEEKIGAPPAEATVDSPAFLEHFWRHGLSLPPGMAAQVLADPSQPAQGVVLEEGVSIDLPQELAHQTIRRSGAAAGFLNSYARWQEEIASYNFAAAGLALMPDAKAGANAFAAVRGQLNGVVDALCAFAEENAKVVDAASNGEFLALPGDMQERFWQTSFGVGAEEASALLGEDLASHVVLVNAQVWSAWLDLQNAEYNDEADYSGGSVVLARRRCNAAKHALDLKLDAWHNLQEHLLARIYPEYSPQSVDDAAQSAITKMAADLAARTREQRGGEPMRSGP